MTEIIIRTIKPLPSEKTTEIFEKIQQCVGIKTLFGFEYKREDLIIKCDVYTPLNENLIKSVNKAIFPYSVKGYECK